MYRSNSNSAEALKQFSLQIPRNNNNTNITGKRKDYDNGSLSSPLFHLSIRNPCKDIIHIGAIAEEYYHIELICNEDNGVEYGIQAYGEEANELYNEINRFSAIHSRHLYKEAEKLVENDNIPREEELEELKLVKKAIDCIADYDLNNGCVLIFKKFKNICISKRKIMYD
jgi:hypothetical protein